MSDKEPNDRDPLISFIAQTIGAMRAQMARMSVDMATKDDLALIRAPMATKDDLALIRAPMATKDDLALIRAQMATKDDLAQMRAEMATKHDLAQLGSRFENKLEAGLTAVRGDIERLGLRVENLDAGVSLRIASVETSVSRLRSVVYLLAKDQPDLVRLLGHEPA
jgi:hypothetical protein